MIFATHSGVKICPTASGTLLIDSMAGDATKPLTLRDLAGKTLLEIAAAGEWTLERVVELLSDPSACKSVSDAYGADAYIGSQWIGSTEV